MPSWTRPTTFCFFQLCLIVVLLAAPRARAQDFGTSAGSSGYKFQPPRPPSLDGDQFDDEEDAVEFENDGFRPPPPGGMPGMPGGGPGGMPTMERPPPPPAAYSQSTTTTPKKFRFKVVEGEYWEKGKKRSRGSQVHVSGAGGESDSRP